jgi:VIT1/CCC1 family predicted Fe2+/Mn2+ transporter
MSAWRTDRSVNFDAETIDFVVYQQNRPVLALQIAEPAFGLNKARSALAGLEKVRAAASRGARCILIIVGYSSMDVLELLERTTRVVVVHTESFEEELRRTIADELLAIPSETSASRELEKTVQTLQERLAELAASREREAEDLTVRLRDVVQEQEHTRRRDQIQESRRAWLEERQRISGSIREARAVRLRAEIDEIREMHTSYERQKERRTWVVAGAIASVSIATLFILTSMRDLLSFYFVYGVLLTAVAAVWTGLVVMLLFVAVVRRRRFDSGQVRSPEDLERVARQQLSGRLVGRRALVSSDPYVRYSAAVAGLAAPPKLIAAAEIEPSSLVRRRLVQTCVSRGNDDDLYAIINSSLDDRTVSVALEGLLSKGVLGSATVGRLSPPLRLLAALYGETAEESDNFLERFLASTAQAGGLSRRPKWESSTPAILGRAYRTNDDNLLADTLRSVMERELRVGIDLLSPFEPSGLGSYDWLKKIDSINERYVFFRKAYFFLARGLDTVQNDTLLQI